MLEEFKKTYNEIATKKRAELDEALARGEVSDPITGTLIAWGAFRCLGVARRISSVTG